MRVYERLPVAFIMLDYIKKLLHFFFTFLSSLVGTHSFETGTERSFSFVNDVNVYELKTAADSSVGYRISGDLKVSSIYGDSDKGYLFKYEVKGARREF